METALYLITGFLGSGKTTLMRRLLTAENSVKTGIIVNEFGQEGIDGSLLSSGDLEMTEINNGSIFCTCKSDRFIEALITMSDMGLDAVYIETSGMANPRGMGQIIDIVKKQSGFLYDYRGCITIVDATNVEKLISVSPAVSDQIAYADYILINKTDLVPQDALAKIRSAIKGINDVAPVAETSYADIEDIRKLLELKPLHDKQGPLTTAAQSGVRKLSVEFPVSLDRSTFKEFLNSFSPLTYRFKGFVMLDGKPHRIDCAGENISLVEMESEPPGYHAEIISDSGKPLSIKFKKAYRDTFGANPKLK